MDQEALYRIVMVALAAVLYAQCAAAAIRIAFRGAEPLAIKRVLFSAGSFAALVIGCLALADTAGIQVATWFAVLLCIASLTLLTLLSKRWRRNDAARIQRLSELNETVHGLRLNLEAVTTPEALCARAAKEHNLTRREEDMLLLLCRGHSYAEIAEALYLSPNTVKSHIRSLYRKMGAIERAKLSNDIAALAP